MRDLYERLLPVARLSHPAARHRAAQSAAGGISRDTQRRPLRDLEFLARRRCPGRSAQLRHHRPPALRRPQRPRRPGPHEGHRRSRRQALLRLSGAFGRAHTQAGFRPTHPLPRRPRRPRPARSAHPHPALRQDLRAKPASVPHDDDDHGRREIFEADEKA